MKTAPVHILALRFSALGDVAMTVPVLKSVLAQHPQLQITMVSIPFHAPLFEGIDRLHFYGVDIKKDFKGIPGLMRLARKLKTGIRFDAVADLHDVLRTKIIRRFLGAVPIAVIDKGRKEKKELTRPKNKKLRPLPPTFERYAAVFRKLGIQVQLTVADGLLPAPLRSAATNIPPQPFAVGIAPFAKHAAKMYPAEKMKEVIRQLQADRNLQLFLFGSRTEAPLLQQWAGDAENITVVAGTCSFKEELQLIAKMNVILTMDSANMHLASLYGVPVVSVWGGTHPYLGFYGWGQDPDNAVQTDLPCRPSSVFGNKPCPVHGAAGCMQEITPGMIVDQIKKNLYS
ncbi:glycosyltransferase family 9 protein [Niabella beijingensis]|uniref:glycosyltransferase family 9 protein n=1 Tax=Niabella beijingensis TaxID=2872700 RepID=UPI001CC0B0A0|nr:glycosyltransferase family 9 protein [Niabella beijingensis]MBZ4191666.1 glycosyltransferase family 9 protein [Niabella beijingensis]